MPVWFLLWLISLLHLLLHAIMSQTFASMPKTAVENIQHLLTLGAKSTILDTVVVQLSTDFNVDTAHVKKPLLTDPDYEGESSG